VSKSHGGAVSRTKEKSFCEEKRQSAPGPVPGEVELGDVDCRGENAIGKKRGARGMVFFGKSAKG